MRSGWGCQNQHHGPACERPRPGGTKRPRRTPPLLETIPHFGYTAHYSDVWTNLHLGFRCVFECPGNFWYAVLTCGGWALVYFADTFMNHFSPTLNSMVNEFTAPTAVLVMFAHPAWALGQLPASSAKAVALDVVSVVALVVGVAAFARYEAKRSRKLDVIMPPHVKWEGLDVDAAVPAAYENAPVIHSASTLNAELLTNHGDASV